MEVAHLADVAHLASTWDASARFARRQGGGRGMIAAQKVGKLTLAEALRERVAIVR